MGQCCAAEPVEEPMPVHKDVHDLLNDMQQYKRANSKDRDLKVIKRRQDAKNKIEAYKERMKIRGHSRSLTPATLHATDGGADTAVYGHESFHKNSEQRFNLFKESAGREVKRRSRQPQLNEQDETEKEAAGAGAESSSEEVVEPKKAKKVKKGRRGRSKDSSETPQGSVDREYEKSDKNKKKKKKHKKGDESERSEDVPAKRKKKKKKNQKN